MKVEMENKSVIEPDGVNSSYGVNNSNSVNLSYGVNNSNGVNWSDGVSWSDGLNWSNGVNWSSGVNWSDGVNKSYGVLNSYGVDSEIFCADKKRVFRIFGKEVSKKRFDEVWGKLHDKLSGWFPKFHNGFELYILHGGDWSKIPVSEMTNTLKTNDPEDEDFDPFPAWKDMPQEAIDYLKSLPEFDAVLFKRVTGIDV